MNNIASAKFNEEHSQPSTVNYIKRIIYSEELITFIGQHKFVSAKFDRGTFSALLPLKDGGGKYLIDMVDDSQTIKLCGIDCLVVDELTHPINYRVEFKSDESCN